MHVSSIESFFLTRGTDESIRVEDFGSHNTFITSSNQIVNRGGGTRSSNSKGKAPFYRSTEATLWKEIITSPDRFDKQVVNGHECRTLS
ncbi:hypothetical protein L1987_31642 [Smallanthus sonchifolius]|uniref:Uncharacterized protein n=1 Tax=Smallanthus sonchifolius TaxID=185202 RepID=A0ACB9I676_9ASTR|nr:hypothetical protein L1987_31642 [Smallanthus sonchifolius]